MKRRTLPILLAFLLVSTPAMADAPDIDDIRGGPADMEIKKVDPFNSIEIFHAARCELFLDICDWSWTRHQCECGIYEPNDSDG